LLAEVERDLFFLGFTIALMFDEHREERGKCFSRLKYQCYRYFLLFSNTKQNKITSDNAALSLRCFEKADFSFLITFLNLRKKASVKKLLAEMLVSEPVSY